MTRTRISLHTNRMRSRANRKAERADGSDDPVRTAWPERVLPVLFWLAVWQAASAIIGQEVLLASPVAAGMQLASMLTEAGFWLSVLSSLAKIALGFACALVAGTTLAALAARSRPLRLALRPLVHTVKAVPVASFVILVLVWIPSSHLSVVIALLMAFPIIYSNVLEGVQQMDIQLLEVAEVFRVGPVRRLRYLYLSQVLPYFHAASALALGMCWKAGVAAEVIGIPHLSIGEHLYDAKVYLDTPALFAWTAVIVALSVLFEKCFCAALAAAVRRLERAS